jgi:hypothetical protein
MTSIQPNLKSNNDKKRSATKVSFTLDDTHNDKYTLETKTKKTKTKEHITYTDQEAQKISEQNAKKIAKMNAGIAKIPLNRLKQCLINMLAQKLRAKNHDTETIKTIIAKYTRLLEEYQEINEKLPDNYKENEIIIEQAMQKDL